jgi:hypothetical protein
MAQVDKSSLHDFATGEKVTESMLDQNFEVLRVSFNDIDKKLADLGMTGFAPMTFNDLTQNTFNQLKLGYVTNITNPLDTRITTLEQAGSGSVTQQEITDINTSLDSKADKSTATSTKDGLMSFTDKATFDFHMIDEVKHITDSERNNWNDKYTKNEVDNKINGVNTGKIYKTAVNTYSAIATTYPSPQTGWSVLTLDTGNEYTYSGTAWVQTGTGSIPLATSTQDGKMSKSDFTKLQGIETNANKYIHPDTHPATMIVDDSNHRFVTDTDKTNWNGKASSAKVNGFINIAEYNAVGDGVTSDQTAVVNAIADAVAKGYLLNWGNDGRTYLVTDTIPNFHTITHIGNAIIKRGTTLFYISPKGTQTNNLYVAPSSPATNDGLTSDKPVGTIQKAFDYLANYGPILTGNWQVNLAAGNYARSKVKDALLSENPILVKGPDVGGYPNVPTAIVTEGTGISATGIQANKGTVLTIQDVKFVGYNGNSSSNGASCSEASRLYTINVHCTDCYWGVTATHRSYLDIKGGIFDHCGYLSSGTGGGAAIRSLMLVNHYIGDQYGTALGIEIKNCYIGMFAQELSTGHANWIDFHDNIDAVRLAVNSRCNLDGSSFKRNTRDIRTTDGSAPYITSTVKFASSPDESGNRIVTSNGSNPLYDNDVLFAGSTSNYSITERIFDFAYKSQSYNSTSATTFYTKTLKAEMWRFKPDSTAIGKKLTIKLAGALTGTAGTKNITVRFTNGTRTVLASVIFTATETGAFVANGELIFNWDTTAVNDSQYLYFSGFTSGNTPKLSRGVGNVLLYVDSTFSLECSVANAADSIYIDTVQIGVVG